MNALVVSCHADDETLGCGGTVAKLVNQGHDVFVVIMTRCATDLVRYQESGDPTENRRSEAREAVKVLGVTRDIKFGEFPEMRLSHKNVADMAYFISNISKAFRPQVVFCHHWSDLNQDHRIVAEATMVAMRPHTAPWLRRLLAYPIDPLDWHGSLNYRPGVLSDISDTVGVKLAALRCYKSEMREYPHPRSIEAVDATVRANGVRMGRGPAELFDLVWEIDA